MSHGSPFIWHEDVDECAKRVPSLGGSVLVAPHDVPEFGRVCRRSDGRGCAPCAVPDDDGKRPGNSS